MKNQFREMSCPALIINGMPDHVHCLFNLHPEVRLSEVIKHVKGGSSYFMNKENISPTRFSWQNGYGSFAVNETAIPYVIKYIRNQKTHHQKESFAAEYISLQSGRKWNP